MARRNWNMGTLLNGFQQGYDVFGQVARDRDMRKVAEEQPTETPGSPIDGDPAAVQEQLAAGAGMGEARRLASTGVTPTTHSFMGKTQEAAFTPEQISSGRRMAQAGVLEKHGDFEAGGRIRSQLTQEEEAKKRSARDDLRFTWEQGDRTRLENDRQREDAYRADRDAVFQNSSFFKRNRAYGEARGKYDQDLAEYQRKVDAGDTSAVEPVAPARPMMTVGESMLDRAESLSTEIKYGKASADSMLQFAQLQQQVMDEGYLKTLRLAHSGAPLTKVVEQFNVNGQAKIDPSAIVSDKMVDRPGGVKSRLIQFKRPDGSTMTIDTLADLDSLGKAGEVFERAYKQHGMAVQDQQVAISRGHLGVAQQQNARAAGADARAAEDHAAGAGERQLRQRMAGLQLDLSSDDAAKAAAAKTKIETIKSVGVGSDKDRPAEEKLASALLRAGVAPDMKSALEMALSKKGTSPEELHRELVTAAAKGSGGAGPAVKKANEIMSAMGFQRSGTSWVAASGPAASGGPPDAAVEHLKKNPQLAAQFDQKYGRGASAAVLGR